jgi:hypothetical protein
MRQSARCLCCRAHYKVPFSNSRNRFEKSNVIICWMGFRTINSLCSSPYCFQEWHVTES